MKRETMVARVLSRRTPWDLLVVGGGATGVGVAVDAASRGYDVLVVERSDFGKGTSSRSTKLVHGGVRYLRQGHVPLVIESLRERGLLLRNAPHLVLCQAFVVPAYSWWETPFYGMGLKLYSLLAGRWGFGGSRILSKEETLRRVPALRAEGLRGGVLYHDGQFDDARLLIHLVATAAERGATLVNYAPVESLTRDGDGGIDGAVARDLESGEPLAARARVVVNAAGPFCDEIRRMAEPSAPPMIRPSQGIHLVLDGSFLGGDSGVLVPRTKDGRVMFAIPWHGHVLVGTTDTPIDRATEEPLPRDEEIELVLATAGRYLRRAPTRADILSVFVGVRPLLRSRGVGATAALTRDHTIRIEGSRLLTITGGKWTTYRSMAEEVVTRAAAVAGLPARPCVTRTERVHGYLEGEASLGALAVYGADAEGVRALAAADPAIASPLHPALPYAGAEVVWAARQEMARTVEDVLARRTRALFLNARAAVAMAPDVARLLARELGRDERWAREQVEAFEALARGYLVG